MKFDLLPTPILLLALLAVGPAGGTAALAEADPGLAAILRHYPVRPPWPVAGADYPVGVPAGTILRSPQTIAQRGVSVDPFHKYVGVSASDVVLDGYDFSGWEVELLAGATRLTIRNSKFLALSQKQSLIYAMWGGYLTLIGNTIDGGGAQGAANPLVFLGAGGALVEKNLFEHVPNDAVNTSHDGKFVITQNLFTSLNYGEGHTDCVQTFFTPISQLSVTFNTVYQPAPDASGFPGGGNAFVRVGDERGHPVDGLDISYNTLIYQGNAATRFANVFDISADGGQVSQPTVHDNYIDPAGVAYGIWSPYAPDLTNPTYYGNIDLRSGKPILAGSGNSQSVGVTEAAPASPRSIRVDRDDRAVRISGWTVPGFRVDVEADRLIASTKAGPTGWFRLGLEPSVSLPPLRLRVVDGVGNAGPSVTLDPESKSVGSLR